MSKFMSRKFWVAVSALGAAIVGAASGQIPWSEALPSMAAIVIGYCAAQGWVDGKEVVAEIENSGDEG
tara:strand:- start:2287 stop:2490 length:204 start_codon:yes stop_codon:yes gene_type:complete